MKPPTFLNHPPEAPLPADNRPLVAPIYQSVKFTFDDVEETAKHARGERPGYFYSRISNPTLHQLELTLAHLQGREACLLTASGVAAVSLTMLGLCKQGDHVVVFAEMYQPTRAMVRNVLARYGVRYTVLSVDDLPALERTLAATPTRLVVFESPTNPVLKVPDLERLTSLAKAHGALTVMDNTLAGFHNHGQFPVDVYVHSLTKFASGHGDVMGGAVIAGRELIAGLRPNLILFGAALDPHAAFLIQRGLKTYFLRYEKQCANALAVAEFLAQQAGVARVRYPGLPTDPYHEVASRQMQGFGTMVSLELGGGGDAAKKFAEALRLFAIGASLGSTESLVLPAPLLIPRDLDTEQRAWSEVTAQTVRLSIGVEDIGDLLADLGQALG